jgi:three-Cys-motif partner protein
MTKRSKYEAGPDGWPVEEVGPWAKKKLKVLADYIGASSAARRKFNRSESSYIDVFCGAARSKIRTTGEVIDGSPLVAVKE